MPISRRIWGWFVFALGLLWFMGGIFGLFHGVWQMALMAILGFALLRRGWSLTHPDEKPL